ncbi:hypothetical protein ACFU99_32705 [Streptomyces sp. NPDC057654]|uniref:terpene synthase family protein n=1 Tax=Streptomyces sp. NPDC057654 TaxID=3346196 RepID=UPI0036C057DD
MVSFFDGFELPPFFSPYGETQHPDYPELERRCIQWCDDSDLYPNPVARAWGITGTRPSLLHAWVCHQADPERLLPVLLWGYWVFAVDDAHEAEDVGTTCARPGPRDGLSGMIDLAARVLCGSAGSECIVGGSSRYAHLIADITDQMRACGATHTQIHRIVQDLQRWMVGELWTATNNTEPRSIPTIEAFTLQRLASVGSYPAYSLASYANDCHISDTELHEPAVQAATNAGAFVTAWDNDLISYPKEEFHDEANTNIVTVMAGKLGCSPQDAVSEVVAIRDRVMSLFLALRDQITPTASHDLIRHLDCIGQFTRANLDWSASVPRYSVINDHKTPPPATAPEVPLEWTARPSDTSMQPVDIPPIAWWWDTVK